MKTEKWKMENGTTKYVGNVGHSISILYGRRFFFFPFFFSTLQKNSVMYMYLS